MDLNLMIGGKYLTASKEVAEIKGFNPELYHPWIGTVGGRECTWTEKAKYNLHSDPHEWDLVSEYHEPSEASPAPTLPAISKRELIAAMAMQGILSNSNPDSIALSEPERISCAAVTLADSLIAALKEKQVAK